MKFYIIIPEGFNVSESQTEDLKQLGEVKIIVHKGKLADLEELKKDSGEKILSIDHDAIEGDLDIASLDEIKNIKAISVTSSTFDWIRPKELRKKGIIACNAPGATVGPAAEYAVCMAIECLRRTALHMKNNWQVDWDAAPMSLEGKTVGIIGLGRMGMQIAEKVSALGAKVTYWSKNSRNKHYTYKEINELFTESDVIIPAFAESEGTRKIITNKHIDSMKSTAIIVGLNRIKFVLDEEFILDKVAKNEIGGYAFEGDNAKELSSYKGNVWAVPAIAWFTDQSLKNLVDISISNMVAVAKGVPQNVVN